MDRAGSSYWNSLWGGKYLNQVIDPSDLGIWNTVNRKFHDYFCRAFYGLDTAHMRLLEIGCGNSGWLPYFRQRFGFEICGIDYSESGCEMERRILSTHGITGNVVCADMFSPPQYMMGAFDVVVSFGVVEHFEDTAHAVSACALFAKRGGLVLTNIPNMVGAVGFVTKLLNRPVFDTHMLIDDRALSAAHEKAGCDVLTCRYFIGSNFGVVNLNGVDTGKLGGKLKSELLIALGRLSKVFWLMGDLPPTRVLSPYINCVARKRLAVTEVLDH